MGKSQPHKVIVITGQRAFQAVSGEKSVNTILLTYVSAGGQNFCYEQNQCNCSGNHPTRRMLLSSPVKMYF